MSRPSPLLLNTLLPQGHAPPLPAALVDRQRRQAALGTDAGPHELGAIYRAHAPSVARWAARLGGPSLDVEDVVQEVFLTAHRHLASFRGDAKITTWLFRITRNAVRHRLRKDRLRRWLRGSAEDAAGQVPSPRRDPAQDLEQRQASQTVYRVLETLSDRYRTAFVLFELEGLSGEEIATLLGQKQATVWVWLHRARAQFLAGLKKLEAAEGRDRKERA